MSDLQSCYLDLTSMHMKKRSNSYKQLLELINNEAIRQSLDNSTILSWETLFLAANQYISLESDKCLSKDKKSDGGCGNRMKCTLLLSVVELANKRQINIPVSKLVEVIGNSLNIYCIRLYYTDTYLDILKNYVLIDKYVGHVPTNKWTDLLNTMKFLCGEEECRASLQAILNCLLSMMKCASLINFPIHLLRNSFTFIMDISRQLNTKSSRIEWETLFQLLIEFCRLNMNDCRRSCCKLGEETYYLSFNFSQVQLKIYLYEFYLLQMELHHPNGAGYDDDTFCCYSWNEWKNVLNVLNRNVQKEINNYQRSISYNITPDDALLVSFCSILIKLSVELNKQFNCKPFLDDNSSFVKEESMAKRPKIETNLSEIIVQIESNWNLLCLTIFTELLNKYPELISAEEYVKILNICTKYKPDLNTKNLTKTIYDCLNAMFDVEELLVVDNANLDTKFYWKTILETNLKFFVLYDNVLLQKLIRKYRDDDYYTKKFGVGLNGFFPFRRHLLNLIAESLCDDLCTNQLTAAVLVGCTCQSWPKNNIIRYKDEEDNKLRSIRNVNGLNALTKLIESKGARIEETCKITMQEELFDELLRLIRDFVAKTVDNNVNNTEVNRVNVIILLTNLISGFLNANVIDKENFDEFPLTCLLAEAFECDWTNKVVLLRLPDLFALDVHPLVFNRVRNLFDTEHIMILFNILASKPKDVLSLNTLSLYSTCCKGTITNDQVNIFEAILNREDYKLNEDCNSILKFATAFERCVVHSIPDATFEDFLRVLLEISLEKYEEVNVIVDVLEVLRFTCKHAIAAGGVHLDNFCDELLLKFYTLRNQYGSKQSEKIIECFHELLIADPKEEKIRSFELIPKVIGYLLSPHHKLRLMAVEVLITIFNLLNYDKQKYVLEEVHTQFKNENFGKHSQTANEEDESLSSVSLLHFYAGIMNVSTLWNAEALYYLLEISFWMTIDRKSLHTLLSTISQKTIYGSVCDLITSQADYLLEMWFDNNDNSLKSFPYSLLSCADYTDLCKKFRRNIVRLLIRSNDELVDFARTICTTTEDLIQESFVKFVHAALTSADLQKFAYLLESKQTILDNCVELFLEIFAHVYDEEHFHKQFGFLTKLSPTFIRNMYDRSQCETILEKLQSILSTTSIIRFLLVDHPDKVQQILLKLLINVRDVKQNREMKEIQLHRYTIFIDLLLSELKETDVMYVYFKRFIFNSLMHLIKQDHSRTWRTVTRCSINNALDVMTCNYVKKIHYFLSSDVLNGLFLTIINELVSISGGTTELANVCLEVLEILFVTNVAKLEKIGHLLDPFPEDSIYANLNTIYNRIKYKNGPYSLEREIRNFIEVSKLIENINSREEGLKHLKKQLCERTKELNELYAKLDAVKHDLIHHEDSIVHQLIRVLIKYAQSENWFISSEASNCLGALGPRDIKTIVMQMEKNCVSVECKPEVFVTGKIMALLAEYIVDSNIEVMTTASAVLYDVFKYKEAKVAIDAKYDYGSGVIEESFILPFVGKSCSKKSLKLSIITSKFSHTLNDNAIWCPCESTSTYKDWLTNLVVKLTSVFHDDGTYFPSLIDLLQVKLEFCEALLPLLLYLVLIKEHPECCGILSTQIAGFFDMHINTFLQKDTKDYAIVKNKMALKVFLDVIVFVRTQQINNNGCDLLTLDYLKVAKAAQYCGAFCSSIYYAELWCNDQLRDKKNIRDQMFLTRVEVLRDSISEEAKSMLQDVLDEAYLQLGDIDAGQGCYLKPTLNVDDIIRLYSRMERWDCAVLYADIINAPVSSDIFNLFQAYGLYNLPSEFKGDSGLQYEFAWRLSKWDMVETNKKTFEEYHYFALKAIKENRQSSFNEDILNARNVVTNTIRSTSLESSKNLYRVLTRLQSLKEIEEFNKEIHLNDPQELITRWKEEIEAPDFVYLEPIKSQRIAMLNDQTIASGTDFTKELFDVSMDLIKTARNEKHNKIALRILENLSLSERYSSMENQILFEKAQLTWLYNKDFAMSTLRHLLNDCQADNELQSAALRLYGNWLIETYSTNAQVIISNYFLESIKLVQRKDSAETFDQLARYSDQLYQGYETYVNSTEFVTKVRMMEKSRLVADNTNKKYKCTTDERRAYLTHDVQSKIDQSEIETMLNERHKYLNTAFKYYLLCLRYDDNKNIRIFRIISLWLKNRDNYDLEEHVKDYLKTLPSYKFIPVLPQLVPHLSNAEDDSFAKHVFDIIHKCSTEHPHHTLPLVMSIANAHEDLKYENTRANTQSNEPRLLGSQKLLELLKRNDKLKKTIEEMELLNESLIELAYHTNETSTNSACNIPRSLKLKQIKNYNNVLLPTLTMPIDIQGNYSNVIGVHNFESKFNLVGGINAPKRITCVGTDGISRLLLVKGKDDLRQDAVMQQVFTIMNQLLASNKETRNLRIRTYNVVPLSKRSGILEWVDNSMPIGDYLTGRKGAHQTYNPGDLLPTTCMDMLRRSATMSNADRLKTYLDICAKFRPVFHKFFETFYLEATVWYERRRAYTQSVATSSMCGYILGIGDRHVQNILIDKRTAEVIHIDFGIAFEQGRVLPTPEMVPFRLTRDVEDGMGVFGIEGLFKKLCERSLEVLRNNSKTILSILEVLLYDPLYTWAITPAQAHNKQFDESTSSSTESPSPPAGNETNTLAERALSRLRSKLEGTECISYRATKAEVERLIHEARDPSYLSTMFRGWQAYL